MSLKQVVVLQALLMATAYLRSDICYCNTLLQHVIATRYCNMLLQHVIATCYCNTLLQHVIATRYSLAKIVMAYRLHSLVTHFVLPVRELWAPVTYLNGGLVDPGPSRSHHKYTRELILFNTLQYTSSFYYYLCHIM